MTVVQLFQQADDLLSDGDFTGFDAWLRALPIESMDSHLLVAALVAANWDTESPARNFAVARALSRADQIGYQIPPYLIIPKIDPRDSIASELTTLRELIRSTTGEIEKLGLTERYSKLAAELWELYNE